jgi:hypothetical protein
VEFPIPQELWEGLISPLEPYTGGFEGVEWECGPKRETVKIEKNALFRLDYLLGVGIPDLYNWKSRTFGLGSRSDIDEISFSYGVENWKLKVKASFIFPANK